MWLTVTFALLAVTHAGRAPYLGGDIQELIEATKVTASTGPLLSLVKKPVTEKQRRDSTNYNAKFADIAKAYAEGYKAAIKAVQARAFIAKRRLLGIKPKSIIPSFNYRNNPYLEKVAKSLIPGSTLSRPNGNQFSEARVPKSTIPVPDNVHTQISSPSKSITTTNDDKGGVVTKSSIPVPSTQEKVVDEKKSSAPSSNGLIANSFSTQVGAMEKSWIPHPSSSSDTAHHINERSAHSEIIQAIDHPAFSKIPVIMRSEEERSKIAKLNARARHRNIYFDAAGGDPFHGGGVLSVQNAISKKHRRRRSIEENEYERRPYYEVEYSPMVNDFDYRRERRSINEMEYAPVYNHYGYERRRRSTDDVEYSPSTHFVRHRRSHMPYLGQNLDAIGVVRAIPKSWAPHTKKTEEPKRPVPSASSVAYIQSPSMDVNPVRFTQFMPPAFRGTIPQPMAMMSPPMAMNYAPMFPNPQAFRSMIPSYPAFMPSPLGYAYQAAMPSGIVSEKSPSVETQTNSNELREKKSTIPEPEVGYAYQAAMPSGVVSDKSPSVETQTNSNDLREKKSTIPEPEVAHHSS